MARQLTGTILSDKMNQTAVVVVTHLRKHPRYEKYFKVSRKFKAHNEGNAFHAGEQVIIEETRPLSKEKRWKIVRKVEIKVGEPQTNAKND